MGVAAWVYGHPSVAAELTVKYLEMVPLGTVVQIDAFIVQVEGKKVVTAGGLIGDDGTIFCEGQGLFVEVDPSRFGEPGNHAPHAKEGSFGSPGS
jgi:predicted thioesterase